MVAEAASSLPASHPPIKVFYYHYHNSIRTELDDLSAAVAALEDTSTTDASEGLSDVKRRVAFLDRVYSIHSSVEDEVVYPALDLKVKNVTHAYSVEHEDEERLLEQLSQVISAAMLAEGKQRRAAMRQLMCKVQEIHTTLLKHLAKEEEQLFPLLLKHFSYSEQAQLVAQLLCCIPLTSVEPVLTWLTAAMPQCEQKDLLMQIQQVVPDSMLLQLLVAWLSPRSKALSLASAHAIDIESVRPWKADALKESSECCREAMGLDPLGCPLASLGSKVPKEGPKSSGAGHAPLKHIAHVHAAIRSALDAFASEAASLAASDSLKPAALAALVERLRFLRAVCSYHSASEDDVLFPAVRLLSTEHEATHCLAAEADHEHESTLLEDVSRLLGDVRASVRRGAREVQGLVGDLRAAADAARSAITGHMAREEADVLPLLEARLCARQQRDMVWRTLRAMPLRLLERVLPWLAEKLTEEEAKAMLQDLQLAAPADEGPLVGLLSRWAARGRQDSPEPQGQDAPKQYSNSTCGVHLTPSTPAASSSAAAERPAKRRRGPDGQPGQDELHASSAGAADHISAETHAMPAIAEEHAESKERELLPLRSAGVAPIDHIFQFHKALRRDLRALENDARALAAELEDATDWNPGQGTLQQLEGRFRCLAGMYKAHSQAEDEIIFPALEAKEALSNVSHAYTLDHQQEEELFDGLHAAMNAIRGSQDPQEARKHAATLQRLTAATRASMEQHVRAEEQEVWPLFAEHFTEQEQEHLVGQIVGRTGAEVLQAMLPWVTESFTEQEQRNMMESLRSATRNTGFERWLDATLRPQPQADAPALDGGSPKTDAPALQGDSPKGGSSSQQGSHHGSDLALAEVAEYLASDAKLPSMGSLGSTSSEPHVFRPGWEDIFRMNQKQLEEAMRKVHADSSLDQQRKAYLSQNIMASKYIVAQQRRMHAIVAGHGIRSYADPGHSVLGCSHYQRGCQVLAPCCGQVYPCKKCHDQEEDHQLEVQSVQSMVCMACGLRQPSGASCSGCGQRMARYYCGICNLWDDQPGRDIYHCPFCNLCRVGKGLGIDACHCMDCNTCMHLTEYPTHKCRDLAACPVCTDALFDSSHPYRELPCGHFMHSHCFAQYTRFNYTCPVCSKSMGDMSIYFGMLDSIVARDLADLPSAYQMRQQKLLCNDCGSTGEARFHFVYHKCPDCTSYNTRVLS